MPIPSSKTKAPNSGLAKDNTASLGEDFYAQVLNSLEDYAVFTLDKKGNIASWNTGAERLFGYGSTEAVGHRVDILFTPEDIKSKAPQKELKNAQKYGRAKDERWHVRKDGSRFWASGLVYPLKDDSQHNVGFTKIARDLTERRKDQMALMVSETARNALYKTALDAIIVMDQSGNVVELNPVAEEMFGYSKAEAIGQEMADLIIPSQCRDMHRQGLARYLGTGQGKYINSRVEVQAMRRDGSIFPVELTIVQLEDGSPVRFLGTIRDISDRTRMERELRQREERFRTLLEQSADAIQLISPEGKMVYTSDSVKRVLGYSPEDILGGTVVDYVHPDDIDYFQDKMAQLLAQPGGQVAAEYRVRHKDGSWAWIEATGTNHLNDPTINAIVGNFRNITERKHAVAEQERLMRQFEAVLNQMPAGVVIAEVPSGKLILGNKSVETIWGRPLIPANNIAHYRPYKGFHADGRPYQPEEWPLARSVTNGEIVIDEQIIYQRANGQRGMMNASSSPVTDADGQAFAAVAIFTDTTDKAASEEQVGRLAAIVDSTYDAIISKNLDSIIQTWNPAAEKLFGYTAEEAIGQHISITIPPELVNEEQKIISNIRKGIPVDHYETVRITKDGRRLEVSLSISPVRDSKGTIIGASNIARDISERVKLERQKDDFIAIATHELKTPVTSIKAYVQALHRRFVAAGDDHTAQAIAKIDGQLNKMTNLIQDLLDVTRMGQDKLPLNKAAFSLDQVVEEARDEMQHSSPKHSIVIEGKIGKKLDGDADRIGQVITNYLSNAIKYSPNADKVIIHCYAKDGQAIVGVEDFGVGIARDKQQFVFDRFYRVSGPKENTFPGLGLGLYISSQIIQRHGGKIWLESAKGKGSTFYFSLPLPSKAKQQ